MASIRVILLTCRRPLLFRRALASLLAQTFEDWVCEVHNDAPDDDSPSRTLTEMVAGDPRFTYHKHIPAWGAVASFNHFFRGGPEAFVSLLEDDNWWEPNLLSSLHAELSARPSVNLAWANMRFWQERADGTWTDTGSTIWPIGGLPKFFEWPVLIQAFGSLHSNGAMLFRTSAEAPTTVPEATPFVIVESARERAVSGGFLLLPQVLANFALTLKTARSEDRALWVQSQLLIAASFFENVPLTSSAWDELWKLCRSAKPKRSGLLLMMALAGVKRREVTSRASIADLAEFACSFVGNMPANLRGLRFRKDHPALWAWLNANTAARTDEARARGWRCLDAGSPFSRHP
jgi:hypothetical protein